MSGSHRDVHEQWLLGMWHASDDELDERATALAAPGLVVDGDLVAARWSFTGRYAGGIPGADAPEGTEATLVGADTMRIVDGRIHEYWALSDGADLMTQLAGG